MAFLIGGANSAVDTGYSVGNSCRFDDGSSDDLTRTQDSTNVTNGYKYTFSTWIKRGALGAVMTLLGNYKADNEVGYIHFDANDFLEVYDFQGSGPDLNYKTDMIFRDVSAWYNIVVSVDGTRSANARCKIYVNGSQVSCSSTVDTGGLLGIQYADATNGLRIGSRGSSGGTIGYLDGYMAETIYIDGAGLAPTDFGEFNSNSPTIWQPIDVSGLTFGNNGFYLNYADSGDLGDDESGNTNDLTENNIAAANQGVDSPTNNFCTMNPLIPTTNATFSEGNCKLVTGGSSIQGGGIGTFGVGAGKWWWEVKIQATLGNHTNGVVSELTSELYTNVTGLQNDTGVTQFRNDDGGEMNTDGTATTADYGTFDDGDIMGIALNADDNQISIYDNGSAIVSNFALSSTRGNFLFPYFGSGINTTWEVNFGGCPAFALSSAANDANGYGNFEHAPPSGYLALCSKNLGSSGG